ncbi:hypothetical protein TTRE_0000647301 [Trichuris trichiura]|uniref:Uncharacterized protein n=1 Tax=Trichuris trichiura TaxID=36087 RepID=A0A077ZF92_TRITR|nr:hypothetical protein TTRE_0000647301 [Trichuris trichiura]
MHSFEDISQTDRATASVEVITSMQCDMNDEAVELDYGCNEIGFSESDCPRKAEPDSAKQESSQTADNNNLNGVDLEEGEVVEVEDGEILEDSEVRSEQDSMCRLLPERNLEGRRDVFGTGKQNFHDHFGWKKDECRRNSSSPYQSRFAGRVSRPQEASGTIADEAWKRGLETMYRDEPHGLLTTSEHHRVDMSPKGRGYTYGGEKHDWERRYDRGKGERYQSSSYNRERSRPLPYVRTLQDEMDWRDPWQRPISPGRNKRSLCASSEQRYSADVRQCYGRSRSSTSSGSSETTDSKSFHRKRKLHKRRRRSVTKGRRSSSADSFSSISSDHKAKGLSRNTSFGRSHSKSSTADKEPEESPRDLVRTIFAEKKQMKLSSSMHQSSDESPSESLEESRKSVSSECSDSCHSTGLGEFTTEDEITADLDEEDNQDLKDVRREDLVRKIRMIEAEIEKRRSRLSTRND